MSSSESYSYFGLSSSCFIAALAWPAVRWANILMYISWIYNHKKKKIIGIFGPVVLNKQHNENILNHAITGEIHV